MGFRAVTRDDVATLAGALAEAFVGNPTYRYNFRESPSFVDDLTMYFAAALEWSVVAGPGATAICDDDRAAAMVAYRQPGQVRTAPVRYASTTVAERSRELSASMTPLRPAAPHLLLGFIGVHPTRQGQGLGSGLIAGLQHLRGDRPIVVATMTSSEEAARWLERRGFQPTAFAEADERTGLPPQYGYELPFVD